jgi:hypothetical protein
MSHLTDAKTLVSIAPKPHLASRFNASASTKQ